MSKAISIPVECLELLQEEIEMLISKTTSIPVENVGLTQKQIKDLVSKAASAKNKPLSRKRTKAANRKTIYNLCFSIILNTAVAFLLYRFTPKIASKIYYYSTRLH